MTKSIKRYSLRKTLCTLLVLSAIASLLSVSAFAVDPIPSGLYQLSANSGTRTFTKEWVSATSDRYGSYLTYGFNTYLIDEDYAWAEQSQVLHWAEIKNGNGWHYGPFKAAGSVSKKEVTHSGTGIYYASCWN